MRKVRETAEGNATLLTDAVGHCNCKLCNHVSGMRGHNRCAEDLVASSLAQHLCTTRRELANPGPCTPVCSYDPPSRNLLYSNQQWLDPSAQSPSYRRHGQCLEPPSLAHTILFTGPDTIVNVSPTTNRSGRRQRHKRYVPTCATSGSVYVAQLTRSLLNLDRPKNNALRMTMRAMKSAT